MWICYVYSSPKETLVFKINYSYDLRVRIIDLESFSSLREDHIPKAIAMRCPWPPVPRVAEATISMISMLSMSLTWGRGVSTEVSVQCHSGWSRCKGPLTSTSLMVFLVIGIYPISSVVTMPYKSSFLRDWHVSCQAQFIFYNCSPVWGDQVKFQSEFWDHWCLPLCHHVTHFSCTFCWNMFYA